MEGVLSCKLGGILDFIMLLQTSCVAEQFTHQLCVSLLCYQIQITALCAGKVCYIYIVNICAPTVDTRLKFCHHF